VLSSALSEGVTGMGSDGEAGHSVEDTGVAVQVV
jgi:hypothetical protein